MISLPERQFWQWASSRIFLWFLNRKAALILTSRKYGAFCGQKITLKNSSKQNASIQKIRSYCPIDSKNRSNFPIDSKNRSNFPIDSKNRSNFPIDSKNRSNFPIDSKIDGIFQSIQKSIEFSNRFKKSTEFCMDSKSIEFSYRLEFLIDSTKLKN